MLDVVQNAILQRRILRLRINSTPEGQYILAEPYLILNNILHNRNRLLMYIVEHWAEDGHTGWTDVALDSIIEILETDTVFVVREIVDVDWQLHDQVFPPVT